MLKPDRRSLLAGAAGAVTLSGCANARVTGFDKVNRSLDIANTGEPLSLDPHKASGTWENNIIGNMFVGLTTEDRYARPIPGMAERWETSEDGLTWTFFLRGAQWSDGQACNAHDFQFAFRRILDPRTHAQYATYLYPIKNAEKVVKGELAPDEAGVTALDDRTLQIELEHPAPYLLQLLKHYTCYPVPKHIVQRHGDAWIRPDHVVVNGPYILRKWWSNYMVHLERNPRFYDAAGVALQNLYFYPSTDVNAAARSVESRERGWSTWFPSNQVDALEQSSPGYVRVAPYLMTNYLSFNMTRRPFNDARVRHALSMAIDREFLAQSIYKSGERPAYSLVPPGIDNYPGGVRYPWAGQTIEARREEAQRLLRAAGFGPNNPLTFEYSHRNTSDNPRVAVVVQNHWSQIARWVVCEARPAEVQVHYENLRQKRFQAGDGAWVADYNDPRSHLYLLETRTGLQNYSGYSNPVFDDLVAQADRENDLARRGALMAQAEQLAMNDAPICATVFGVSRNLVHPDLAGYENNVEDIHRARWFGVKA